MMKPNREFAGVSTYEEKVNIEEHFEELYNDDGQLTLVSKKDFLHEEEGLTFKYKYLINGMDIRGFTGEMDAPVMIELVLVPSFSDLSEEARISLGETYDWDEEMADELWRYKDIADYGYGVTMGSESFIPEEDEDLYNLMDSKKVVELVESACAIYEAIDNMRGFYMDRPWNMIGTTGWDTIGNALDSSRPLFKF